MLRKPFQQFGDTALRRQRLDRQLDSAAAGQAETMRFLGGDVIGDNLRHAMADALLTYLRAQVILDATSRHRPDHIAIARYRPFGPGLDPQVRITVTS